ISAFRIQPNPTNGRTAVQFSSETAFAAQLVLVDLTGRMVRTENHSITPGEQSIQLDLTNLPGGLYFARLSNDQGGQRSFKVVKE
ncbi:MAG: T9SS type A sorting domain-containing protein, partial [Saprospiraceae bacterium]|nr:T9SS type A sorting domain-containing protein [Saprospiraceae bacterium]